MIKFSKSCIDMVHYQIDMVDKSEESNVAFFTFFSI
jgi:hypothetical protein